MPEGDGRQAAELRAVRDGVRSPATSSRPPCGEGSRLLGIAYDLEAFGVCWHRTYSDVEGLEEQCLPCPGDKNYTLVKVFGRARTLLRM